MEGLAIAVPAQNPDIPSFSVLNSSTPEHPRKVCRESGRGLIHAYETALGGPSGGLQVLQ